MRGIWLLLGKLLKPQIRALPLEFIAEGISQFFAAFPTNSIWDRPTLVAAK